MATFTQAFAEFGIRLKNPQGLTMCADRIRDRTYRLSIHNDPKERRKPGWHGLVRDVEFALARTATAGSMRFVIRAESVVAKRKVIADCRALKNKWKITHFDEAAGELTMIPV
jgi:hypothetical protein